MPRFSVVTDRPAGAGLSSMIDEICRTWTQRMLLVALEAEVDASVERSLARLTRTGSGLWSETAMRARGRWRRPPEPSRSEPEGERRQLVSCER